MTRNILSKLKNKNKYLNRFNIFLNIKLNRFNLILNGVAQKFYISPIFLPVYLNLVFCVIVKFPQIICS